ncbi:MAG: cation transporter [Acidobacteria bacterium]|nr:cation transporter [Acidobacteriota bacterium]
MAGPGLVSKFENWVRETGKKDREKVGFLEGVVSIVFNVLIAAVKFFYGIMFHSISLIADGVHSLSDVLSSVVVIVGFKISARPPDEDHPFGHGRMELIASVIVATLLFVVGLEFLKDSISKILNPEISQLNTLGIVVVAATLLVKEGLARFSFFLGKTIDSSVLIADGHHHRSDAISTVLVLISLGFVHAGWPRADGIGGLLVSIFIMATAIGLIRESASPLLGRNPEPELVDKVKKIALSHEGVIGVHDVVVHDFRSIYNISLHIEVEHTMNLCHAHDISDAIERDVQKCCPGWAIVHIDPVNRTHPRYNDVSQAIEKLKGSYPVMETAHDIRIVGSDDHFNIVMDVNSEKIPERLAELEEIRHSLNERFPEAGIVFNIDPPVFGIKH